MGHLTALAQWLKITLAVSPTMLRAAGVQLAIVVLCGLIAFTLRRMTVAHTDVLVDRIDPRLRNGRIMAVLRRLVLPTYAWVLVLLAASILAALRQRTGLIDIVASLLAAWIVINAISTLVRDPLLSRAIATVIWLVVALEIVGLLVPTEAALNSFALTLGSMRLSLLGVIKAAILLAILLWIASAASRVVQLRIDRVSGLSPSIRLLIANLLKIALVLLAIAIALDTIGVDLTALAVFSGAIGVGIGFGLQKIVSNLISGVILLLDQSVKPGDVIEVEQTFGWITSLGARYTAVRGRDGKEYLIPNEDLITNRVVNWSYSSSLVRLDLPFGVAYGSDLHRVRDIACAVASATPRIKPQPPPLCHVTGFGDSSINLLLRIWIEDPVNGVTNVKGDVFLALYDSLNAHGIELPFPQREIRIRREAAPPKPQDETQRPLDQATRSRGSPPDPLS